jgi:putative hydrolase of the HAD superfamily
LAVSSVANGAKSNIAAVLFDAVGTLIYADPPVAEVYRSIAANYGSQRSTADIRERFRAPMSADSSTESPSILHRPTTSEALELERWRRIVSDVIDDIPTADREPLFNSLWQHFAQPQSWRLFDDVASVWEPLQDRGYRLGIASNFDSRLRTVAAGLLPLSRCDTWFISSELGLSKPDPRFFRAAEQQIPLKPSQILLIGDDWTNDILGGQAAGWSTVWLDRSSVPTPMPHIAKLTELLSLLPPRV